MRNTFSSVLLTLCLMIASGRADAEVQCVEWAPPIVPSVILADANGTPILKEGEPINVPALVGWRGYPVFGPDSRLVPTPIEYTPLGRPAVDSDGNVILLTGKRHPHVILRDALGAPIIDRRGTPITAPALIGRDGRPVKDSAGNMIPMRIERDYDDRPLVTAEGNTILSAPDIPMRLPMIGPDGSALVGPSGQVLLLAVDHDESCRPRLGLDGKPMRSVYQTDEYGRPVLGEDGQPIVCKDYLHCPQQSLSDMNASCPQSNGLINEKRQKRIANRLRSRYRNRLHNAFICRGRR